MTENARQSLLVVAAHPGDFVWRSAGAIAVHQAQLWNVLVVCASLGVKGEAGSLWQENGATIASVTDARRSESKRAADILGVELRLLDLEDYPLIPKPADTVNLAALMREVKPTVVITHAPRDSGSVDHVNVSTMVMQARSFASAPGYGPDVILPPDIYYFEPHQPEQSDFRADILLNITDYWPRKRQAFEAIVSQRGVWDYYERLAMQRGAQAGRRSKNPIAYAEAFQRAAPAVTDRFA